MAKKQSHLPEGHPEVRFGKTGILLINLGSPDAPHTAEVRRYLRQFLSDRRVIELTPCLWQIILNLFILPFRPKRSAEAYRKIWRDDGRSPLCYYTEKQAEALRPLMQNVQHIDWAMRYGSPSIAAMLQEMREAGCDRILIAPLYPQYSATTTASVQDEVFRCLMKMRWQPSIRILPPYHDHPAYIDALKHSVDSHLKAQDWEPEVILASFHGLPRQYFDKGDPYHCHCHKTARLLRESLKLSKEQLQLTFQSRFGPKEWLQPYTQQTVHDLAKGGTKKLAIIMPGFAADCLETLEEIAIGIREEFLQLGGTHFTVIPCLNDSPSGIAMLHTLLDNELKGWVS
ncbi:MAG: ferrochelatase [Rickettsiales bacterium]|nr:ferrochelatase [Rickettsiales bacterium]